MSDQGIEPGGIDPNPGQGIEPGGLGLGLGDRTWWVRVRVRVRGSNLVG